MKDTAIARERPDLPVHRGEVELLRLRLRRTTASRRRRAGPISWKLDEVKAGAMKVEVDGAPRTLYWDEVATEPGWCKLDWVVADPTRSGSPTPATSST